MRLFIWLIESHARAYSRSLYEGSRYCAHYTARMKCIGSGMLAKFEPRPNEAASLLLELY
jgi:hypothetical protein